MHNWLTGWPTPAVETVVAKNFPMEYVESPIKAEQLTSKVQGTTMITISKDFPRQMIKKTKAQDLRSKWEA